MEIVKPEKNRKFFEKDLAITTWANLEPLYQELLKEPVEGVEALEDFLRKVSELEAIISEDMAWRYINMTRDTTNEDYTNSYKYFITEISPNISVYADRLNRKVVNHPNFEELDSQQYITYTRSLKRETELFREENVPLQTEAQNVAQEYSALMGKMTIEHEGKTLTLQQAGKLLESQDRELRKKIWEQISTRRLEDKEGVNAVMDKLINLRHKMAQNAGYDTYTAYKFDDMQRFDYAQEDTIKFHEAVEQVVKPVYQEFLKERSEKLGIAPLRPWDLAVDLNGTKPLEPFTDGKELLQKSKTVLGSLRPDLGKMLAHMEEIGFLDLESRVGKAPGGYNYPLYESGIPFIFMNAAGTQSDVITLLHESGHAIHSIVTQDISLNAFKSTPSEVAELASMSMELMALDYYDSFYSDEEERIRAQKDQLKRSITLFPWIATIDAFQQWMYDHPTHNRTERNEMFVEIAKRFHGDLVDWSGYEDARAFQWQRQLHIFEVPFYYIEYAIAQLGALAVWQNFKQDAQKGLEGYLRALKMGYKRPIPEIYEAADIRFDFGAAYMKKQVDFCLEAYKAL
ncbi:MAG: M3 family oligoendopeptidase [Bacteroidota bacterium]